MFYHFFVYDINSLCEYFTVITISLRRQSTLRSWVYEAQIVSHVLTKLFFITKKSTKVFSFFISFDEACGYLSNDKYIVDGIILSPLTVSMQSALL